jgi:DNA-binding transcriptional regulator YiaG
MPAIICFLGYNPLPPSDGWLVRGRRVFGLSQKEAARRIGVDQCTLARWERGERKPTGPFAARAERFLKAVRAVPSARTA